ncbi:MAG: biotin--[acetyl-CoA-carboxylase] ligase [Rikenellaceae bacterium]|nr:biotin--[acetyl-CoA-carboxylase] ligase [Rikenellaceae bacterium]
MIYRFDTLSSTNDEARNPRYLHGDIILADYQTEGRGQRGNSWSSVQGKNLMFSLVAEPVWLPASEQFSLLECVALALVDTLAHYGIDATIKWTNDIYVGDRKLVGVLIENSLGGHHLWRSIIGVGINVNQSEFAPNLPNPTSMSLECGREFPREDILELFVEHFWRRYEVLKSGQADTLHREYVQRMFRLNVESTFRLSDGTLLRGTIRNVAPHGDLIIDTDHGLQQFLFKQIAFVI